MIQTCIFNWFNISFTLLMYHELASIKGKKFSDFTALRKRETFLFAHANYSYVQYWLTWHQTMFLGRHNKWKPCLGLGYFLLWLKDCIWGPVYWLCECPVKATRVGITKNEKSVWLIFALYCWIRHGVWRKCLAWGKNKVDSRGVRELFQTF